MIINIIPLGFNCTVSYILRNVLNINTARTPFEWNTTIKIDDVIKLFNNKFDNFINEDFITITENDGEIAYHNNYNIVFQHDAIHDPNTKKWYLNKEVTCNKYRRRISRLFENIEKADLVIFIRISLCIVYHTNDDIRVSNIITDLNDTPEEIKKLDQLKNIFSNKNVEILYINTQEDLDNLYKYINNLKDDNQFI